MSCLDILRILGLAHSTHREGGQSVLETVGTTSFLTNLYLGGNQLEGTIPAGLTTSSQLTIVDLSNNAWIVGSMPNLR